MATAALPNNLPAQFTSFVGRVREREQASSALARTRLLVLTGAGGVGKTRLALELAAARAPSFPDGAWWVDMAPLQGGEDVQGALAAVLDVRPLPGRTETQAAAHRLASDCALVILDNCEHVPDAAADLCEALLRGCPRVTVLATSRVPLGVPGESDWRVPSLSLPQTDEADSIDRSDAGRLFLERAAKVGLDLALQGANAAAVARICRDLDGVPLAIELAAARVRMLSVQQIADGLSDRFRLLTGGPRGLPRQRTLRASVDWSYELLSAPERGLFRRLAAFTGGWSLEAVEAVCAGDGLQSSAILELLTSLVDKSLVAVEHRERAARYRLLETVRQYALHLLRESGELPALRDRQLEFFVDLSQRAERELNTPRVHAWLEILEPETANILAAIDHAIASQPEQALRIGVALTAWWKVAGQFSVGRTVLARALDAADQSPSALRARALWSCGYMAQFAGDVQAVGSYVREAMAMAESVGDELTLALALHTASLVRMRTDPVGSRAGFERGRELARRLGHPWLLLIQTATLGRACLLTDEFDEAERWFTEAGSTVDAVGVEAVTQAAFGLGWCAFARGELQRSLELSEQAVSAARELGDPITDVLANSTMARVEIMQGRAQASLARSRASEARGIAKGAFLVIASARIELARALAATGRIDEAQELLAVVVAGGADSGWHYCNALLLLTDVLRAQGDADAALTRAQEALQLSERLGARSHAANARELMARLAIRRREWSHAEQLLHLALDQRVEIDVPQWLAQTLDALAQVAAGLASHAAAARMLGAAERARADLGVVRWPLDSPAIEALELALSESLGADAYAAARAEGAAMSLDQAIGWARRARGSRKRPADGWESLTPTELQVVQLAAEGLTNPQIAQRMFITRGTVKVHLGHIFQKLDVRSRAELAAQAARRTD